MKFNEDSRVKFHEEKEPITQIAHLVFADTQANAKKPKKLFFANAHQE